MDYYELLGLKAVHDGNGSENSSRRRRNQGKQQREREKQDDMSHIDSKQVRKAYRSQAQLWHPDKISKKNNDDHTNKSSATGRHISIEESNALMIRATPGEYDSILGAIVGGADDTAAAKMRILAENGITVVESPAQIGQTVKRIMGR